MIRDKIKDEHYFIKYIDQQKQRIGRFQIKLDKKEVAVDRIFAVQEKIDSLNFQIFIAEYSLGVPVENLVNNYKELVKSMPKFWNPPSGYVDMLWMVSLGIMLEVDDDTFDVLVKLVEESELDDFLLNFLMQSRNNTINLTNKEFLFKTPYEYLLNVINRDKDNSTLNLKQYLENEWYHGHNDTGWYDCHKHEEKLYFGYWSFESGAIAKILKLDDSTLKDVPYYPYDMVHYQKN